MAGYGYTPGYSDDFRARREAEERERERLLREQKEANDAARDRYLAKLEGEKAERAKRREQEIDAELEPIKAERRRLWLADHYTATPADFERVWKAHLREQAIEERRKEQYERTMAEMRRSGMYSF